MFFGGGFPGFDMPGGFGGPRRGGGGGPVNNSRYYELLGVSKDADETTIKKVRRCTWGLAACTWVLGALRSWPAAAAHMCPPGRWPW